MKKVLLFLKKELMLTLSLAAALAAMIITPPTLQLFRNIDWRTLGTLFMMLCVLEGFKKENVLKPVVHLASNLRHMTSLSLFLVFGVFFTSMFVTNDVSLIIFGPNRPHCGRSLEALLRQYKQRMLESSAVF